MMLEPLPQLQGYRVQQTLYFVQRHLPFRLRELHADNGAEFLNQWVVPWCQQQGVRLTRGRPYRKNDQAVVEQRNWSAVRRVVGYDRLEPAAFPLLRAVYQRLVLQLNYVRPLRKLVGKERIGSRVIKRYDVPRTPYERLLASGVLSPGARRQVEAQAAAINPAQLQREIQQLLTQLWKHATLAAGETADLG